MYSYNENEKEAKRGVNHPAPSARHVRQAISSDPVGKLKRRTHASNPEGDLKMVAKYGSEEETLLDRAIKEAGLGIGKPINYNPLFRYGGAIGAGMWAAQSAKNEGATTGEAIAWSIPAAVLGYHGGHRLGQAHAQYSAGGAAKEFLGKLPEQIKGHEQMVNSIPTGNELAHTFLHAKGQNTLSGGLSNFNEGLKAKVLKALSGFSNKSIDELVSGHYGEEYTNFQNMANADKAKATEQLNKSKGMQTGIDSLKTQGYDPEQFASHVISRADQNHLENLLGKSYDEIVKDPIGQSALKQQKRHQGDISGYTPFMRVR